MQNEPQNPADQARSNDVDSVPEIGPAGGNRRPLGVYVVAGVVGLEALALAVIGVVSIVSALSTPMHSAASGVFLIVLLLALSAGLGAVAFNAFKGMRWTRSAAFVWQLLMVAIAVPALLEGNTLLGLAMVLPAVAAAYFLFTPKVVEFSQRTGVENNVM